MKIMLTGGAGFIGSAVVRHLIAQTDHSVLVLDKLTYAGSLFNLAPIQGSERYQFLQGDICDAKTINSLLDNFKPDAIIHLAAESHVDRSIDTPSDFVQTNIMGTYVLLNAAARYQKALPTAKQDMFRFLHVSTDEVYGSLGTEGFFDESSPYLPNSPYSSSKASSDHLVRAWHATYELNTLITHCSNNYGPYQHQEKLIPKTIINAISGKKIPIYGAGKQIRDWLFVEDHVGALLCVLFGGRPGETYDIGGRCEKNNFELVHSVCDLLDTIKPSPERSYRELIEFVKDRPGHDFRYGIRPDKIEKTLGWKPTTEFNNGIEKTVNWYLTNHQLQQTNA
jgi:dTDP-glucose 4,6-dehydratase